LVELFDGQKFARLLSSRYVRCVQTFEPLAEARALPIELVDGLTEGASRAASIELLLEAALDGPVAMSTHGDVMLNVLDELAAAGAPFTRPVLIQKGSTWILDVANGSFAAGRYLPPP
jgi:broad specificity phosphatase PhoE